MKVNLGTNLDLSDPRDANQLLNELELAFGKVLDFRSIASGASGQILTSGGANVLPSWADANYILTSAAYGSQGTTTTVLHGNASGVLSFGAVVEADITLAANTTNNVSTTKHGFAPILPNDATKYLDGTGNYTVPAGGGGDVLGVQVFS